MKWSQAPSARRRTDRPYPEFTRIQEIGNVAEAKYNSLSVKLTRRLDKGLSMLGGYTFSKSRDNGSGIRTLNGDQLFPQNSECLECEWGLSIFDVRHRVVSSILYELPFGEGKPFAQTGVGGAILGGWQVSNIMSVSSGFPRNSAPGSDRANTGSDQRANLVPGQDPKDGPKTIDKWFNTDAFALQPLGTYGNSPRNIFHGPGIFNFDMSIIRNFRLGGSKSLQFRLEAFNTFNQPVWNDPNTSLANLADVWNHHQHEKADARAAARFEVLVLDTRTYLNTKRHGGSSERKGLRAVFL